MMLRIKEILKQKQVSVSEVAENIGLTYVNVINVVNEKTTPSFGTLVKIANFLNVPISSLFSDSVNESKSLSCPACGTKLKLVRECDGQNIIGGLDISTLSASEMSVLDNAIKQIISVRNLKKE